MPAVTGGQLLYGDVEPNHRRSSSEAGIGAACDRGSPISLHQPQQHTKGAPLEVVARPSCCPARPS